MTNEHHAIPDPGEAYFRAIALLREGLDAPVDVDRIRDRVIAALDRPADEERRWPRLVRGLSMAAAVLLAVAIGWFWLRGTSVDAAAYHDSAAQHGRCALSFPEDWEYHPQRMRKQLDPRFAPLADRLVKPGSGYGLIEAHNCSYEQRRYAHFIFRGPDGDTRSLFVEREERGALRRAESREENLRVTARTASGHHVFVVSDDGAAVDEPLTRTLLSEATRFLSTIPR